MNVVKKNKLFYMVYNILQFLIECIFYSESFRNDSNVKNLINLVFYKFMRLFLKLRGLVYIQDL